MRDSSINQLEPSAGSQLLISHDLVGIRRQFRVTHFLIHRIISENE